MGHLVTGTFTVVTGMFSDGMFSDGTFNDGMFSGGMFSDGTFSVGTFCMWFPDPCAMCTVTVP